MQRFRGARGVADGQAATETGRPDTRGIVGDVWDDGRPLAAAAGGIAGRPFQCGARADRAGTLPGDLKAGD